MPYSKQHKAETRARIVDCARRLFNRHGFEAVSIEQIMAEARLTRGGFYNHFATKAELFSEAIASYAHCNPSAGWDGIELDWQAPARTLAAQVVTAYLSRQHLEDLDAHCPMIALPSDTARAGPAVRRTYEQLVLGMVEMFEAALADGGPDRRRKARAMTALCIGGMVLARTLEDDGLATDIREAARALALEVGALA